MLNPPLPFLWPSIEKEIAPFQPFLTGVVLNAGSGSRRVKAGDSVINLDLDPKAQPDVLASLLDLPFEENSIDSVLSIAAIEHVERPWVAFEEFFRVLKPGGHAVIGARSYSRSTLHRAISTALRHTASPN